MGYSAIDFPDCTVYLSPIKMNWIRGKRWLHCDCLCEVHAETNVPLSQSFTAKHQSVGYKLNLPPPPLSARQNISLKFKKHARIHKRHSRIRRRKIVGMTDHHLWLSYISDTVIDYPLTDIYIAMMRWHR